jgi:hypothetical protein
VSVSIITSVVTLSVILDGAEAQMAVAEERRTALKQRISQVEDEIKVKGHALKAVQGFLAAEDEVHRMQAEVMEEGAKGVLSSEKVEKLAQFRNVMDKQKLQTMQFYAHYGLDVSNLRVLKKRLESELGES